MHSRINKKFSVVIIGLGNIGYKYDRLEKNKKVQTHANAFSKNKNFQIIGAVEKNEKAKKDFNSFYPDIHVHKCIESLKDLKIDILVVSSPTDTHREIVSRAVKYIKPKLILLEKPISYTVNNSNYILNLCKKHKILLFVNFFRSAEQSVKNIKKLIDHKKIKGHYKVSVSYNKGLLHNGTHFFDLMNIWFGKPKKVNLYRVIKLYKSGDGLLDFNVKYKDAEVNFIASRDKSDAGNQVNILFQGGILNYMNGGRKIFINKFRKGSDIISQKIEVKNFIDTYQKYVVEEILKIMHMNKTCLRSGNDAFFAQKLLNKILSV